MRRVHRKRRKHRSDKAIVQLGGFSPFLVRGLIPADDDDAGLAKLALKDVVHKLFVEFS